MDFAGSRTEKNVLAAFAGESQARNRYSYFGSVAKKEGYEQIAAIFLQTAEEEKEHAKQFFKQLKGGMVEIAAGYPAGVIGTTKENLRAAAEGEKMEWGTLYPTFAECAKDEGFVVIANLFRQVANVERYHEQRYNRFLSNLEAGTVFRRDAPVKWYCRECGYVYEGTAAPQKCPACGHPEAYFEIYAENF
ncbi:MAG: rubrerythrin [Methanoregula sp.]|jgi:rubrerythrin